MSPRRKEPDIDRVAYLGPLRDLIERNRRPPRQLGDLQDGGLQTAVQDGGLEATGGLQTAVQAEPAPGDGGLQATGGFQTAYPGGL